MIYFISGGVRSGKSQFAEIMTKKLATDRKIYLATSIPYDDEMKQRVKRHQLNRVGDGWVTIEKQMNLKDIIPRLQITDVILLDCLTILLSNEMFNEEIKLDVVNKIFGDIMMLNTCVKDLVIVSNDIFSNAKTFDDYTINYIKNLGQLQIKLVQISEEVYECIYGLNIMRKEGPK